jgi:hypothetical protein
VISPDLPEFCYFYVLMCGGVVLVQKGKPGYFPVREYKGIDPGVGEHIVTQLNEYMGVDPAQREAMLAGSMFGWHKRVADPAIYRSKEQIG